MRQEQNANPQSLKCSCSSGLEKNESELDGMVSITKGDG